MSKPSNGALKIGTFIVRKLCLNNIYFKIILERTSLTAHSPPDAESVGSIPGQELRSHMPHGQKTRKKIVFSINCFGKPGYSHAKE